MLCCVVLCCVVLCVCVGLRSEISEADLSKVLPEEVEEEVRQAAEISMGRLIIVLWRGSNKQYFNLLSDVGSCSDLAHVSALATLPSLSEDQNAFVKLWLCR